MRGGGAAAQSCGTPARPPSAFPRVSYQPLHEEAAARRRWDAMVACLETPRGSVPPAQPQPRGICAAGAWLPLFPGARRAVAGAHPAAGALPAAPRFCCAWAAGSGLPLLRFPAWEQVPVRVCGDTESSGTRAGPGLLSLPVQGSAAPSTRALLRAAGAGAAQRELHPPAARPPSPRGAAPGRAVELPRVESQGWGGPRG